MNQRTLPPHLAAAAAANSRSVISTSRFSTHGITPGEQFLAWRQRVGHVVDAPPSKAQVAGGFRGEIDLFAVGGMVLTDCSTDSMLLERSVARVSTDSRRDYVFQLFVEGEVGHVSGMRKKRSAPGSVQGIVAFDLNQPFRVERPECRLLSLFVPAAVVDEALRDGASLHGRILQQGSPLTGLVMDHMTALVRDMPRLDPASAIGALQAGAQLLVAAFRKEARLTGTGRAALQAAVMGRVRRYIEANLHQGDLTPGGVVDALQLKRATIYRWFEHEGGLGAYIRHRRLREAADELVRFPHLQVTEIAYGLGFQSPSDFTRAFRRAFDMSPQDMRARALDLQLGNLVP
ncbi:AraC family transcriptional regulator [Paraburkholderia ginsengiterrae]|uniref:AraC family transcriptional regulator n=1 Tax=Paraburkholderia ginsengiterrae TaxID=1462993 RepID=A0A1A9N4U6_9BURK|nr:AraC family transcriptional regulator [Paraburkholderia ginsengiterrae]OAJ53220.1 AraC family transcriptional regulator [Paraburkholderia ginsengiterrae]OAJ56683.1 AraC family transcriptional regulator [Paraburkholderia ginsengiterrae]